MDNCTDTPKEKEVPYEKIVIYYYCKNVLIIKKIDKLL
jgi:hypothetical protein